ncbi:hypothetical protein F4810DRAFT_719340 [Camillea tinctor]|nr:hypothetical protein F4810DRAFT_719340 [Camillea tinctor]
MCFGKKKTSQAQPSGRKPAPALPPTELAYHVPRTETSQYKPNYVTVNQCNEYHLPPPAEHPHLPNTQKF